MKIYRRWRTWILIGLMIGLVFTVSIVEWYFDDKQAGENAWREQVMAQKLQQEESLKMPELQQGQSWQLVEQRIAINEYHLEHNIRPTNGTMWDSINNLAELVIMVTLLTIIIAGDSLAGEYSTGTIKMLLIRPVSRTKILVSKYLSLVVFNILLLIILFITSVLLNGILYQFAHLNLPLVGIGDYGQVVEKSMVANLWKTYLLNSISTIIFMTMAFMISTVFRSSAMAIGISLFAVFTGSMLADLVRNYAWGKYFLFAHLDLTQHLNGRPYQEDMTLSFSITLLVVYYLLFQLVAWLVFTRRDVAA